MIGLADGPIRTGYSSAMMSWPNSKLPPPQRRKFTLTSIIPSGSTRQHLLGRSANGQSKKLLAYVTRIDI